MAIVNRRVDQYNAELVVSTTDAAGTIGKVGVDFGFLTSSVLVINDKTTDIFASFNSSGGSTGGHRIKSGEATTFTVQTGLMSFASTTTSTGDVVRVVGVGR